MKRRAKIVCTLGPATSSPEKIRELVDAGMDVARLNLSHGTREEHAAVYRNVRAASDAAQRAVAVLVDLQGPKIRLGEFEDGGVTLASGDRFTITTEPVEGTRELASTTYAALAKDVVAGARVLIDDGRVALRVDDTDGVRVRTTVVEGGRISDHKGINLPGVRVSAPCLSQKDREDLKFGLSLRADLIALSFVRAAEDIEDVHAIMDEVGARLPVIAKIEKPEAVDRLGPITRAFEGLMVARGDLGVEIPLEQVPLLQKRAIRLAREHGKPVIVATQMLDSMIHHPHPTRAEASDVANAVLDGADALMLSGETSVGEHPIAAVETMAKIIGAAESQGLWSLPSVRRRPETRPEAIALNAVRIAEDLHAVALVAFTETGATVRHVAAHRNTIPILAFTPQPEVRSRLALVWGTETFIVPRALHTDEMVAQVDRALLQMGRGKKGDYVVIVAGTPPGTAGSTNTLRVHQLGGE
ncbi:MAG TPA: pyruvate kinase [Methylomirabilota bacterium]|jgi:pyruvate kinase|nr:pyruvate kinase [Methylomirabilota bacterium]